MSLETVGAVIVNWNAGKYLIDCVDSLRSEGISEIVVVDNGSRDGSELALVKHDPRVKLIRLPNPGFGTANNRGARELSTDVVFCINPDTVIHKGAIAKLLETLNSDDRIAIVGPRLLNKDGTLYPSARILPSTATSIGHALLGGILPSNKWTKKYKGLSDVYDTRHKTDWLSGSAMFARKSAFDSVRGFDPAYFMYMEDTDLCWRLREAGWKMIYEPEAVVTHIQGVSTKRAPLRMQLAHHTSAFRYNVRTRRGANRLLLPVIAVGLFARLPVAYLRKLIADSALISSLLKAKRPLGSSGEGVEK